jgi:hypothetical protein
MIAKPDLSTAYGAGGLGLDSEIRILETDRERAMELLDRYRMELGSVDSEDPGEEIPLNEPNEAKLESEEFYEKIFRKFDGNEGDFSLSWNWASFCFGPLWYFWRGMWARGLFTLAAIIALDLALFFLLHFDLRYTLLLAFYFGLCGNHQYYKFRSKRKGHAEDAK